MKNPLPLLLAAALSAAFAPTNSTALEATAGSNDVQNAMHGLDSRLNASNAILLTSINQILTCNQKRMIFTPDATDPERDADGCVSPPLPGNVSLELEDVSVPAGISRSETNDFTHTFSVPASVKPWGAVTLQMTVFNGKYRASSGGYPVTYTIDDVSADQAKTRIHKASSDGCESPGSASYTLDAAYDAGTRNVTLTYNRSSTKSAIDCRTIGFDIHRYQYKKAVLTQ